MKMNVWFRVYVVMESVPTQKVPINARVQRATPQAAIHRDVSVSNWS